MDKIIDLKNISFKYGKLKALDKISLNLGSGIYGLLGPNGAGKSTLIKTILGFLKPYEGEGEIFGYDLNNVREIRKRIGYMPENDSLILGLDGITFVSYLGELSGLSSQKAKKRAHDVLYFVGLDEERYRKTEQYSAGMKQRLKLAQAIVHSPELLLLDEPTSGMDPRGRKDLIKLINSISEQEEITIIYSSHLLADIEETCDKVIILNKGKILTVDSIKNLKKRDYNSYEIKIKNNKEKFIMELGKNYIEYSLNEKGIYTIITPKDFEIKKIFDIAFKTKTQIRYFKNKRTSLEEKFLTLIGEDNGN